MACNGWLGLSDAEKEPLLEKRVKANLSTDVYLDFDLQAPEERLYIFKPSYKPVSKSETPIKKIKKPHQKAQILTLLQKNKTLRSQLKEALQANDKYQKSIAQLHQKVTQQAHSLTLLETKKPVLSTTYSDSLFTSRSERLQENIEVQPALLNLDEKTATHALLADTNTSIHDVSGAVEFGFNYERDNHRTQSIYTRLILNYKYNDIYSINNDLNIQVESEDDEISTEQYRWQLQGDYFLNTRNILFLRTDLRRSKFASYDQEDVYTMGYGHTLFNTSKHLFKIEMGPGYRMAVPNVGEDAVSIDEFIVRTRLNYERVISESLQVKMDTVLELGRANNTYSLSFVAQNKVYRELYLNFDVDYKYTQNVPIDTHNKEISTGIKLMYAF